jgi:hypothetical protein
MNERKMLEAAAKACGISQHPDGGCEHLFFIDGAYVLWNPLANPTDCAEMCADVGIGTEWWELDNAVNCLVDNNMHSVEHHVFFKDHDNSRLKAWMFAATMVAAKIGGYKE